MAHLLKDLQNPGLSVEILKEHPEFLAFELDNDLSIREEQQEVALAILSDSEGIEGNRLLQMNMGGGKTSVITPLVLAAI